MNKVKIQIIFIILTWLVVCSQKPAQAASLTLTGSGTWTIGTVGAGTTSTSAGSPHTWSVTNNFTRYENIDIQVSVSTPSGWTAAYDTYGSPNTPDVNRYVLYAKDLNLQVRTNTALRLVSNLANAASSDFGLAFTAPTSGVEQVQQTLTITLTASRACGGTLVGDACWYIAYSTTCSNACSSQGGCISTDADSGAEQLAFCNAVGGCTTGDGGTCLGYRCDYPILNSGYAGYGTGGCFVCNNYYSDIGAHNRGCPCLY